MKVLCLKPQLRLTPIAAKPTARLERTFVETGDERCPIAGIWLKIADADQPADDPASPRPAIGIRPWRAFHNPQIRLCYSAA